LKSLLTALFFILPAVSFSASTDPKIVYFQNYTNVRVNIADYKPTGLPIILSEIDFGDGTIVKNKSDLWHPYVTYGNKVIKITVTDVALQKTTYTKVVETSDYWERRPVSNTTVFLTSSPTSNYSHANSQKCDQTESDS
jgi:hypothetical protein